MIDIVCATKHDPEAFAKGPLGCSLARIKHYERRAPQRIFPHITYNNSEGLPFVYNGRINADSPHDILAFIHDDVWIDDSFFADRLIEGLKHFDILGVAGDTRLLDSHVGWAFKNEQGEWDHPYLSGSVAHGKGPFGAIDYYGPCPQACKLLDGVLLAARRSVIRSKAVQFDIQFERHFYDLDFCRSADSKGLKLTTWPIAITHQSGGQFKDEWCKMLAVYKAKWPEDQGRNQPGAGEERKGAHRSAAHRWAADKF